MDKTEKDELQDAIAHLASLSIVKLYEDKRKLLWYNFLIGVSHGVGTVFGASIVVTLFVFILAQFKWVPFIGEFISQVLDYLKNTPAGANYQYER